MVRVRFEQVSKSYRVGRRLPTLREAVVGRRWRRNASVTGEYRWALRDVSFEVGRGDALAIIGPNGAGKTTILKILSRVTKATQGTVVVSGRLAPLLELGAGFHPELTGRENVYLNGSILGMPRSDIRARFDEICDFAGIGDYLDTPVKRYSAGMYVRLGFAVAAHLDPEVLLVDEVLAVGDFAFQEKCRARMAHLRERGTALIFVSHNMDVVRRVCDHGLVLYDGRNVFHGSAAAAVLHYSETIRAAARREPREVPASGGLADRVMTFDAEIETVNVLDERGEPVRIAASGDTVVVEMRVAFHRPVSAPVFSLAVVAADGRTVYDTTTRWLAIPERDWQAGERARVTFRLHLSLLEAVYSVRVDVAERGWTHFYDRMENAAQLAVTDGGRAKGIADLEATAVVEPIP
jgi:ABC-type polysaccharide/polyol phosphate transport system ATPase subunit